MPYVDPQAVKRRPRQTFLRLMGARPIVALERGLVFRLVIWRIAPRLMRVTGGRFARTLPFPAEVIETRDARDGRPHRRVVISFHDGERVTVIPSKAGMADDPIWYQNALADPNVLFGGRPFRAEAVEDPASVQRIWALADRCYPPNATYRAVAAGHARTIPVLQLTPR